MSLGAPWRLLLLAVVPGFPLSTKPIVDPGNLARSIVWVNLYLGLFNLLPAYPMDGGRVLRAFFNRQMDPIRATQRAVALP